MKNFTRRQVLKTGLAGVGLALGSPLVSPLDAKSKKFQAFDKIELGRTGIKASRLAMGTGTKGGHHTSRLKRMGLDNFIKVIRHGLDRGINFIDTADWYGTHEYIRKSLKGISRDKYVLLTKLWTRRLEDFNPSGGAFKEVHRYLKELGTDMIDVVLIHFITYTDYIRRHERVRDELSQLKEKGIVRAVGISTHHYGALQIAANDPWVDVIFARINNKGGWEYKMDGPVEAIANVLKLARKNGKAVVGMKIYAEGKLAKPEEMDASLSFVLHNHLTDAMTIGMTSPEQIDDNIARIARV